MAWRRFFQATLFVLAGVLTLASCTGRNTPELGGEAAPNPFPKDVAEDDGPTREEVAQAAIPIEGFPYGVFTRYFVESPLASSNPDKDPDVPEEEIFELYDSLLGRLAADDLTLAVTPRHTDARMGRTSDDVVYDPEFNLVQKFMDLSVEHGIGVVHRFRPKDKPLENWDHPANVAVLVEHEPRGQGDLSEIWTESYDAKQTRPDLPTLTAMIGEELDPTEVAAGTSFAQELWDRVDSEVRLIRYYPERTDKDPDQRSRSRVPVSLVDYDEWFALAEGAADSPWWFVPQAFGSERGPFAVPTPEMLSRDIHMALAHGARGVLAWELFPAGDEATEALWDDEAFAAAENGLYDSFIEVGRLAQANAEVLANHVAASFDATSDNDQIVVSARLDPASDTTYLYAVNVSDSDQNATITVASDSHGAQAVDLYGDDSLPFSGDDLSLSLAPGKAALLTLAG